MSILIDLYECIHECMSIGNALFAILKQDYVRYYNKTYMECIHEYS